MYHKAGEEMFNGKPAHALHAFAAHPKSGCTKHTKRAKVMKRISGFFRGFGLRTPEFAVEERVHTPGIVKQIPGEGIGAWFR